MVVAGYDVLRGVSTQIGREQISAHLVGFVAAIEIRTNPQLTDIVQPPTGDRASIEDDTRMQITDGQCFGGVTAQIDDGQCRTIGFAGYSEIA